VEEERAGSDEGEEHGGGCGRAGSALVACSGGGVGGGRAGAVAGRVGIGYYHYQRVRSLVYIMCQPILFFFHNN